MMSRKQFRLRAVGQVTGLLLVSLVTACTDVAAPHYEPTVRIATKPGKGGGGNESPGGMVLQGDLALSVSDALAIASTCPSAGFSGNSWALVFGKSLCLIVEAEPWTGSGDPYPVLDDIVLNAIVEKGKNGRITHMRLVGQDVDGPEGIWHQTDLIPVAEPAVPSKAGFTLHVHAKDVAVWRTDSHLGGGNKVEIIGYISIGDVVYPSQ